MKAYVINLDRAAERLAHMRQAFDRIGAAFERIPGVDGTTLTASAVQPFRRSRAEARRAEWLPGEIGCFLGHFEAWTRIAAGPDAWGAVFEDDVHVAPALAGLLGSSSWIPDAADVVRLEANRSMRLSGGRAIEVAPGRKVYRAHSGTPGAAAYLLSKRAAAMLVAVPAALHLPADVFLFKPRMSPTARRLQRFQVVPAVCIQDEVLDWDSATLTSQIKQRGTRGRGYRERSNPLLRLWPIRRHAVPFRP